MPPSPQRQWRKPRRVLIADDEPHVAAALRLLLARQPDVRVVGWSADLAALLHAAATRRPDVILLDWELPDLHADGALGHLRQSCPRAALIALSTHDEQRQPALLAGAAAFVCKTDTPTQVLAALDLADGQRTRAVLERQPPR
jgi:DNA-binding NarL/FixJ family response regulator